MDGERKTALVLGGGGNLGALEVGFVRRLNELRVPIDFVVGTSVGALNAAYVAFHETDEHDCLEEIWRKLDGEELFGGSIVRIAWHVLWNRMSLFDNGFIRELLRAHLKSDLFEETRLPLYTTATNLRTGEREVFSKGSVTRALLASTAIPAVFPPVRSGKDLYVDGAVSAPTDIPAAIELGATDVIAIDLNPGLAPRDPAHLMDVVMRSIAIESEHRSTCTIEHAQHDARIVHIRPGIRLESRSKFEGVEELLEHSYSMACTIFDQCWDGERLAEGSYQMAVPVS